MEDSIPRSIALIVSILASAFFAAAETSYSFCNTVRMKVLADDGSKTAKRTLWICDRFDRTVVTLLVAINILHVISATVATLMAVDIWGDAGSAVATVVLTIVVFLFAENIPKNIARANADFIAMAISLPIKWFIYILWPFSSFFMVIGALTKKLLRIKDDQPALTEDEFSEIVEDAGDDGVIEPEESEIIRSAVEFGGKTVADVMMKREFVTAIPINITTEKLKEILLEEKYSRFPVYDGNTDNIVGILQSASCLWKMVHGERFKIRECMTRPYFVTPETPVGDVFRDMGGRRTHMAIVKKDGKTVGIITMEDILEEIVGEIYDEDDETSSVKGAVK